MRESRGTDDGEAVRRRLHGIWPQARPLPDADIGRWQRYDGDSAALPDGTAPTDPRPPEVGTRASGAGAAPPGVGFGAPSSGRAALGGFDPARRGIRALAVLAALVVLAAGYLVWRAQPRSEPAPAPEAVSAPVPSTGAQPSGTTGSVVVAVAGRVRRPGLVRLPTGARVQDALEAAGGVLPGTDLSFVNLARRLVDGELLVVGVTPPPGLDTGGGAGNPGAGATAGGRVNLNTATLTELDGLPGIGPALAQRIVDYRTAHGGFRSVDELRRVQGIGDAKFAQLKDRVAV